jgi:hypothetical protein
MLPTKLFKQFQFGFPVHAWPPDRAEATVKLMVKVGQNSPSLMGQNSVAKPIQANSHESRQNRPELRGFDLSRCSSDQFTMNLNTP